MGMLVSFRAFVLSDFFIQNIFNNLFSLWKLSAIDKITVIIKERSLKQIGLSKMYRMFTDCIMFVHYILTIEDTS